MLAYLVREHNKASQNRKIICPGVNNTYNTTNIKGHTQSEKLPYYIILTITPRGGKGTKTFSSVLGA